jgi:hypothetical protein
VENMQREERKSLLDILSLACAFYHPVIHFGWLFLSSLTCRTTAQHSNNLLSIWAAVMISDCIILE